jgi:Tim17/Tim22/Tim23/Pmp24 family
MSSESNGSDFRKWTVYFRPVAPGATPAPPPAGLALWSSQTGHATLFGFLLGGVTGLRTARAASPTKPATDGFVNARHRAATYFVRDGVLLGARTGAFVALLSGSALIIEGIREVNDPLNLSCAGALTCSLFGGAIGGWRAALGTGLFGAASGGVLAAAHDKLYDFARFYGGLDVTPFDVITAGRGLEMKSGSQIEVENIASGHELIRSTVSWLENSQQKRLCDEAASKNDTASSTMDRGPDG